MSLNTMQVRWTDARQTTSRHTYFLRSASASAASRRCFLNLFIVFMFDVASRSLFALRSRLGCLRLVCVFVVASFFCAKLCLGELGAATWLISFRLGLACFRFVLYLLCAF